MTDKRQQPKEEEQKKNNDLQNATRETKDRAT